MKPVLSIIFAAAVALSASATSSHEDRKQVAGAAYQDTAGQDLGRGIYARSCSVCHGENGNAASWAKNSLNPPPRDFTSGELGRPQMIKAVTHGVPDTAMMSFTTQLSSAEIAAVVDFIQAAFMASEEETSAKAGEQAKVSHAQPHDHGAMHGGDMNMAAALPGTLVGRVGLGKASYETNCVACHGMDGDGRGPRAYFLSRKPRDFTSDRARSVLNRPHLFEAIAKGVRQTEMAAWSKVLSAQEIADVAEYVFTAFVDSGPSAFPPAASDEAPHPAKKKN